MNINIIYWFVLLATFAGIFFLGSKTELKLWARVITALVLGIILGFIFGDAAQSSKWIGDLFVRLIRMLVIPLIFTSLVAGVVSMGDPKRLGSIGVKTIGLYLISTMFAIVIGLVLGSVFQPGQGIDLTGVEPMTAGVASTSVADRLFGIVPINPISSLANGEVLPIIFFSILLGIGIIMGGEKTKAVGNVFAAAAEAVLKIAHLVMQFAPYGVLCLIAWVAGTMGMGALQNLFILTIILYCGCILHMLLVYGGALKFIVRLPLIRFFRGMLDAQALRSVRVIVDIGMHLGLKIPSFSEFYPGQTWTGDLALEFMRERVHFPADFVASEVDRYLGIPGQAISYKVGEKVWLEARETAKQSAGRSFDLKAWHNNALKLGPMGLGQMKQELGSQTF